MIESKMGRFDKIGSSDHREQLLFKIDDGTILVSAARKSVLTKLTLSKIVIPQILETDPRFGAKLGCFVTLKKYNEEKSLRGCIGFPEPLYKLSRALTEAAVAAATEDPRFPPVRQEELNSILVEVSILTKPTLITVKSPKDLLNKIEVGNDGLILRWPFGSGLLLPQVAKEFGWDAEEFLSNLSVKAGAPPDQWCIPGSMVFKFQSTVFQEEVPNGNVILT